MKNLNILLSKFKNIKAPDISARKAFINIIEEMYGIKLDLKDVKVFNNTIFYNASSTIKAELKLNEVTILDKINKELNLKIKKIV